MTEKLIRYDPEVVLARSTRILKQTGALPKNCPSEECLSLHSVELGRTRDEVRLEANPPQLPTEKEWLEYEIHSTCKECDIYGNPKRFFEIKVNSSNGKVISARGAWIKR